MHIKEEEEVMYHKHITRVAREKKVAHLNLKLTPQFGGINPHAFPISWCRARSFVQGVFEPFKCTAKKKRC